MANTNIINPLLFYLMGFSSKLSIIEAFALGCTLTYVIFLIINSPSWYSPNEKEVNYFNKKKKKWIIILICIMISIIVTPSKDVCKEMIISSMIKDNDNKYTREEYENMISDIIDAVDDKESR